MAKTKTGETDAYVIARCVMCKKTKKVRAGDVEPGDMPFCDCGNVMVAEKAVMKG